MRYKINPNEYPIYGNESYSGVQFSIIYLKKKFCFFRKNSLVCKSAMHDGRVSPWSGENSPVLIQNSSIQSSTFASVLRNGILSSKLVENFN